MAERKAVNKYYPPEWTPEHGSINKFMGQHPLRDRARKLDKGILIIRFEMPYNVWCGGCKNLIGRGTRFNAEKKAIGKYFSTTIWSFRMKCAQCSNWIEIHTDPQNHDYVIHSGAERRTETWDAAEVGGIVLTDPSQKEKLEEDPFYKLEHLHDDKKKAEDNRPWLLKLQEIQEQRSHDDYANNRLLRKMFREEKKAINSRAQEAADKGLGFTLLPTSEKDEKEAASIRFNPVTTASQNAKLDLLRLKNGSIFSKSSTGRVSALEKGVRNGVDLKLLAKAKASERLSDKLFPIKPTAQFKPAPKPSFTVVVTPEEKPKTE